MAVKASEFRIKISVEDATGKGFKEAEKNAEDYAKNMARYAKTTLDIKGVKLQQEFLKNIPKVDISGITELNNSIKELTQQIANLKTTTQSFGEVNKEVYVQASEEIQEPIESTKILKAALEGIAALGLAAFFGKLMNNVGKTGEEITKTTGALGKFRGIVGNIGTALKAVPFAATIEAVTVLGPLLWGLGYVMEDSESKTVSFIGKLIKFAGILTISVSGAITAALVYIGDFIASIGEGMTKSITDAQGKFQEFEKTMSSFSFTLKGFISSLGEESVGTMRLWTEELQNLYETTVFTRAEIASSIKFLVSESKNTGATIEENMSLLKSSMDIAAATDSQLIEVVKNLVSGIKGSANVLDGYNIDLVKNNEAVKEFVKLSGLTVEQIDDETMTRLRLNEVLKKSEVFNDAAIEQTKTIAGLTTTLNKTFDEMDRKIGEAGVFTREYIKIQLRLAKFLAEMPGPIISIVAGMKDFLGVTLILIGTLVKYTFIIVGVVLAMKALNIITTAYLGISISLNSALEIFATRILPLTLVIYAVYEAVAQLAKESEAFAGVLNRFPGGMDEVQSEVEETISAFDRLTGAAGRLWEVFIDLTKYVVLGLVQAILSLQVAYIKLREIFSTGDEELAWSLMLNDVTAEMAALGEMTGEVEKRLNPFSDGVAYAGEMLEDFSDASEEARAAYLRFWEDVRSGAQDLNKDFDRNKERIKALGTEYEKAFLKYSEMRNEVERIETGVYKLSVKDTAEKLAKAQKELTIQSIDMERIKLGRFKEISDELQTLRIEELKNAGESIEAIQGEFKKRTSMFEAHVRGLSLLGNLTKSQKKLIEEYRNELQKAEKAAIQAETLKKLKESLGDFNEELKRYKEKTRDINLELQKQNVTERTFIDLEKEKAKEGAVVLREQLLGLGRLDDATKEILDNYIAAIDAQADLKKGALGFGSISLGEIFGEIPSGEELTIGVTEGMQAISDMYDKSGSVIDAVSSISISQMGESLFSLAGDFAKMLWAKAVEWISKISLNDLWTVVLTFFETAAMFFDPRVISQFVDMAEFLADLPNELVKAFSKLDSIIGKMLSSLPSAIDRLLAKLPSIIDSIASKLPELSRVLLSALGKIIERAPFIFSSLIERIPEITAALLSNAPKVIDKFFQALPVLVQKVVATLPQTFAEIARNADEIVLALVRGLLTATGQIAIVLVDELIRKGGIFKIAGELIKAMPKIAMAFVQGVAEGLANVVKDFASYLFGGGISLPSSLTDMPEKIAEEATDFLENIAKSASQVFQVTELAMEGRAIDTADRLREAIISSVNIAAVKIQGLWDKLKEAWQWIRTNIIDPILNALRSVWQWVMDNIITPLTTGISAAWKWVMDNIVTPLTSGLSKIWEKAANLLGDFAGTIAGLGKGIWEGFKAALEKIPSFFTDIGDDIWQGLLSGLSGLSTFFTDLFNDLNPANLLEKIFKLPDGWSGQGAVETILGIDVPMVSFAQGGLVAGKAMVPGDSEANDRILAYVSPGEAIIPRSLMSNPRVAKLVAKILNGEIPKFAEGTLGDVWGGITGGFDSLFGGVQEILGPISEVVGEQVMIAISRNGAMAQDAWNNLEEGARNAWSKTWEEGSKILRYLNPEELWKQVREQAMVSVLKMFEANKFADGGIIGEGVPMVGHKGEFVVNRDDTRRNMGLLTRINNGESPSFSGGNINIENITINAKTNLDADSMRREVLPALERELKRKSQDGRFVLSLKGVRA